MCFSGAVSQDISQHYCFVNFSDKRISKRYANIEKNAEASAEDAVEKRGRKGPQSINGVVRSGE
ncbi:hypothetical protein EM595_1076 [Duffyella gerundensis]|uniref:Uncharacterized protein n=1 Tax=Duffyella gerundensis TaxID=1619313 RepID=A0A0U5L276_9GAMM|nr:hypothetical protein EM595_1076 [Duffyella gerundensis]